MPGVDEGRKNPYLVQPPERADAETKVHGVGKRMDGGFFFCKGGLCLCRVFGSKKEGTHESGDAIRGDGERKAQESKEILITLNH